jgi:t-SNARE complex subunit (syntaxin)
MPTPNDPTSSRRTRVMIALVVTVVVILFVVVHVTGVIGPGSH